MKETHYLYLNPQPGSHTTHGARFGDSECSFSEGPGGLVFKVHSSGEAAGTILVTIDLCVLEIPRLNFVLILIHRHQVSPTHSCSVKPVTQNTVGVHLINHSSPLSDPGLVT